MEALPSAIAIFIAGFVMFPALIGFFNVGADESRRLWISVSCWAVVVSMLAIVQAAIFSSANPDNLWFLLSVRHVIVGLGLIAILWFLREASGWYFSVLTWLIIGLIVARGLLWFGSTLVLPPALNSTESAGFGILRAPFQALIGILIIATIVRTLMKPWRGLLSRKIAIAAIVMSIVFAVGIGLSTGVGTDMMSLAILTLPVLAVQSILLVSLRRRTKLAERQSERESGLADFGTAALTPGGDVPTQRALDLISSLLHPDECEFIEANADSTLAPTDVGTRSNSIDATELRVPVESAGRPVGEIRVRGVITPDDALFCRSVGITLSAALARCDLEKSLRHGAVHDALTGLPNWALLQDRLGQLLEHSTAQIAVVLCDIVDMKEINDDYGHDIGDQVLQEVGKKLVAIADRGGTVARIGGDEFVIAQVVEDHIAAHVLCAKVASISAVALDAHPEFNLGLKAGLAFSDGDRTDPDRFVRDAEIALMEAKLESKATASYHSTAREALSARRALIRDLKNAITNGQIFAEYQPIVLLANRTVVGVEALARWRTADGQLVPPGVFIPIAEQSGMIMEITRQVFTHAISQLASWSAADPALGRLRLSLNLTAKAAEDHEFPNWLRHLLESHNIDPGRITIELTETVVEDATADLLQQMSDLADLGVTISLDDFGTGYSSLTRLMSLPVSELKIDRAFVDTSPGQHRAIIRMVIGLAESSELNTVAEGIETESQCALMRGAGCTMGQGYLFARPTAADQIPSIFHAAVSRQPHLTNLA